MTSPRSEVSPFWRVVCRLVTRRAGAASEASRSPGWDGQAVAMGGQRAGSRMKQMNAGGLVSAENFLFFLENDVVR